MAVQAGTVEVGVTANLDDYTKGLADAQRAAKDFGTQAVRATVPVTTATNQLTEAVQGLVKATMQSGIVTNTLNTAVGTFRGLATGALGSLGPLIGLAGLGGMVVAAQQAIQAFGQFDLQQQAFAQQLRVTNEGLGVTADSIQTISQAISRDTATPIRDLQQAFLQLGQNSIITGESLERAVRILPDLAVRVGGVTQAVQLLSQVLTRPADNLDQLRTAGIRLSAAQREGIEGANLFTDSLRAQGDVLRILEQELGGEAAARGAGVVGSFQRLANITGELFINFGGMIARFTGAADGARSFAQALEEMNSRLFPSTSQERIAAFTAQIDAATASLNNLLNTQSLIGSQNPLGQFIQGQIDAARAAIAAAQAGREIEALGQAYLHADAALSALTRTREEQDRRVGDALGVIEGRLEDMRSAISRADLQAREFARTNQLAFDDARVIRYRDTLRAIEIEQRRLREAGRPGILEIENERIRQQTELLRFNSEERRIQEHLLRIELQLRRRGQELEPEDRRNLEERLRLMREVQLATATIEQATRTVFDSMASAIADFAATGKFNFHQLTESIIRDLVRIALQAYVVRPLIQAITGFANPMISSAYGVSPGTSIGTPYVSTGSIPAFQHGGSFMVPGSGGPDRPSLLMGLGPGERVDITPAGQARRGGDNGSVTVINHLNTSKDMQVQQHERRGPGGEKIIEQVFTEVMKRFGRGDADQTMAARFGVRSRVIQR